MTNSSLRLAVFAAAAVAVLSLPAAAQNDAAFAAALGKIPSGLATIAQLKSEPQKPAAAPAQVLGPAVPKVAWQKILKTVYEKGAYTTTGGSSPIFNHTFGEKASDPASEYTYMGIQTREIPATSTTLKIDTVTFFAQTTTDERALTWEFITDPEGRVKSARFATTAITPEGKYGAETIINLDISEPQIAARYDAIIKYWSTR